MKKTNIILESTITCPVCTYRKAEAMPIDACVYFYKISAGNFAAVRKLVVMK